MATPAPHTAEGSPRTFPRPETALARVIGDPIHRVSFHKRLKSMNRYVVAMYRIGLLPLLGAGKTTMILTTKGRNSGRKRSFPVGYFRIGGQIHLLSGWGKDANWYKNLNAYPDDVSLQIGFERFPVRAVVLEDPAEVTRTIELLVNESPSDAHRLIGWDPEHDRIQSADFDPIVKHVVFVKFLSREG